MKNLNLYRKKFPAIFDFTLEILILEFQAQFTLSLQVYYPI